MSVSKYSLESTRRAVTKSPTSKQQQQRIVNSANTRKREQTFKEYAKILSAHKDEFDERWRDNVKASEKNDELDYYARLRTLGTGAFGRVMLIKSKNSEDYYAMKILEKKKLVKMKQVEHTHNEKRILQSLRFPFVISLEHCYKDNSYIYMILPFVNGGEMFTHLRKVGKFTENQSRFYAAQVVLALEYLHRCDLVYRDLKPENILIDCDGYLRITDFGFSKHIESRTWTLCGTPEYLAPEIILSRGYNRSVDWWSFGVLVYEMNAGYSPFYSNEPVRIYEKITTGKYRCPKFFADELRDIVKRLLEVDLTKRYGNLKNGTDDIKGHGWFRKIDWLKIYHRTIVPIFVPSCAGPGDDSNFDVYDEEEMSVAETNEFADQFKDF